MGVDLTLLPLWYDKDESDHVHPSVHLDLDRDRFLWDHISTRLKVQPFGGKVWEDVEDEDDPWTVEDPYGQPWTYATAGHVVEVFRERLAMLDKERDWEVRHTRAAVAYLAELPPETKVILRWH